MCMIVDRDGRKITGVSQRVNGSKRRKELIAAEVIDGDGKLLRPISTEGGASVTFTDVLYNRHQSAKPARPLPMKSNRGVTVILSAAKAIGAAIVYGCSGGNHGRHRGDCWQGIEDDQRHRKLPPFRLQYISF